MSSPWGKITVPEPTNLQDIMSEELARDLQIKEDEKHAKLFNLPSNTGNSNEDELNYAQITSTSDIEDGTSGVENEAKSDLAIALLLQRQYDLENNFLVNQAEDQLNGISTVGVSYKNYLRTPQHTDMDSEEEEEEIEDLRDRKDWDRFDSIQRKLTNIPPCGYKLEDGNFITKHDTTLNGQKNVCKIMSFPPEFETGDGGAFDFKLSNKVFNSLKAHSKNEQNRNKRIRDKKEDQATADFGVDQYTRLILYKMVNNQLFERVNGIISIGKEAVIIHADIDQSANDSPFKECVLKVFKTTLAEFKQRDKYIKDDYRFMGKIGKQRIRKTINLWAEKEMRNLCRLQKAGIPCPEVIAIKKHVLVMSFIGENHRAAPKLKDADLNNEEYELAYNQVVGLMKRLFDVAHLVHGDLSEYNILWYNNQCYFLDVSQSTVLTAVEAFPFLYRDCVNVTKFFERRGVENVKSDFELFQDITGCDFNNKIELENMQKNMKMKPHLMNGPEGEFNDTFNLTWDKIESEKVNEAGNTSISQEETSE